MTTYRLYCDYCNWSKFTDGTDLSGLVPHKRSQIQGHIPVMNGEGKVVNRPFLTMPKQFKCPGCGRVVTARTFHGKGGDDEEKKP